VTGTFSTKIAAAARTAKHAALLGAATAASVLGFAGAAHSGPPAGPEDSPVDGMYGDPAAAAPYWRLQHYNDCAEMAAADVVGQITGLEPTEEQITDVAKSTPSHYGPGPIWNPPGGTDTRNLPVLLAHYGIQSDVVQTSSSALEQDLAQRRKVIVGLNGETIWNAPHNRNDGDHFVVVIGFDTTAGVVHLNDSATPDGRDEQVSIATFEQAWAAGHNGAVVTK
jgi:hypothetical protein